MAKRKNGFLKKTGCILISVSLILTGLVFFSPITSEADGSYSGGTYTVSDGSISTGDLEGYEDELTSIASSTDTTVDSYAVAGFGALETVNVSGNLDIGSYAFSGDYSLSSLICTTMTGATATSFKGCTSIVFSITGQTVGSGYYIYDSALYNGTTLVYVPASVGDSFTVKSGTTAIGDYAFDDTSVTELNFAGSASDITSVGIHEKWPTAGTVINAYGASASDYVVNYFTTSCLNAGSVTVNTDSSGTTYSVYVVEETTDGTVLNSYSTSKVAGATISATTYSGYTISGSSTYTVTTDEDQEVTFLYVADSDTITVTITEVVGSDSYTLTYTDQTEGTVISPTTRSGYSCSDTYTVTSATTQSHTFTYTADSPVTTITVTITEVVGDNTYTLTYDNQTEGTVISPTARSGYSCSDTYTVTSATTQSHTFTYTKNSSGSSGGSSGGSSSSSSGSTAKATTAVVSAEAQSNNKYKITEGAGQIVDQNYGPVRIVCDGPLDKFVYVLMDGSEVDKANYTVQSGSTILTFTKEYIASLPVGDHAVQFQYTDGYAITGLRITAAATGKTTTTVTYRVSSDGSISSGHTRDNTPKTADGFDSKYLLCIAIFLLGAGAILFSRQRKLEALLAGHRDEE